MSAWVAAVWLVTCTFLYGPCVCSDFTVFTRTEGVDNKTCPALPMWTFEGLSEIASAVQCFHDPECHAFQYNTEKELATGQKYKAEVSSECKDEQGSVYYGWECLPGYTWNATARICYILPRKQCETWTKAQEICDKERASLIVLKDKTFANFFIELLKGTYNIRGLCGSEDYDGIWIGGSDTGTEGSFAWIDGSPVDKSFFGPGEPNGGTNENCLDLHFDHDFKGNDHLCIRRQPFACGKVM